MERDEFMNKVSQLGHATRGCAHDFHRTNLCLNCGEPREDRLPSHPPDEAHKFAGAYEVGLAYGGPEEGGWYATLYIPLASVLLRPDDDPFKVARELWNAFSDRDDGRRISDSNASGAVCILWETTPGEHKVLSPGRYE